MPQSYFVILGFGSPIIGHRVSQSNYRILNFENQILWFRSLFFYFTNTIKMVSFLCMIKLKCNFSFLNYPLQVC